MTLSPTEAHRENVYLEPAIVTRILGCCPGALPYGFCLSPRRPNATLQARPIAGARDERRLLGVACKRLFGPAPAPGDMIPDIFSSPRGADCPRPPTWPPRQQPDVLARRPGRRTYSN